MKKILFVSNPMECGGVEKSLLSVMEMIDYTQYEVFFMPYIKGDAEWNYLIPNQVKVIEPPDFLTRIMLYRTDVKKQLLKNLVHPTIIIPYCWFVLKGLMRKSMDYSRQEYWEFETKRTKMLEMEFDIAVAWQGEIGSYYILDKVHAKKKISWFHGDYSNYGNRTRSVEIDKKYWKRLDKMVLVTDVGKKAMDELIPEISDKTVVKYNLLSVKKIEQLANEKIGVIRAPFVLCSVGRLHETKGYDYSIEVCRLLKEKGTQLIWYVLGEGPMRQYLEEKISEYGLENEYILLGNQANPYPYIKACDVFVHCARKEGKPIVIDEAKLLLKPIVSTHFSTVTDQIVDGEDGIIVDFDPERIAEAIQELLNNQNRKQYLIDNLKNRKLSTDISELYDIWEG